MSIRLGVVVSSLVAFSCGVTVNVGDGGTGGGTANTGGGTTSTGGGSANTGGGSGGGNVSDFFPCSATRTCPSGQFCFNGICAIGCQSNANCASDQYCDTEFDRLCHNKTVTTCPSTPCGTEQVCIGGLCSTLPPVTQCDPNQVVNGNDNCNPNSVCIDNPDTSPEDPKCYTFPACAQDKTCPTGTVGAVCNDGLIPNKARICLTGLCRNAQNCPSNWVCFKSTSNDVLGLCSNKGLGSPCHTAADCTSGNCTSFAPGFPGFCM